MRSISARSLSIPFKTAFRHAAASREATQTLWVVAEGEGGARGFGEGCPREYVTGESLGSAQAFVAKYAPAWEEGIRDLQSLREWVAGHGEEIDANPAAWTAVELAILDVLGKSDGKPVESLLGLPRLAGTFQYTAVLGDSAPAMFEAQLGRYCEAGFAQFKIKLAGDAQRDGAKARALERAGVSPAAVRADANNLWRSASEAIEALRAIRFPFSALEEPLRAGEFHGMAAISQALRTRIILDESLSRLAQLRALPAPVAMCWLPNIRVSKMGGLLRSLEFLDRARRLGLRVIVGAHVGETSVLARAALVVAAAAGDALAAQEGAFGTHLLAQDVSQPPLMFGTRGLLDTRAYKLGDRPGLGLTINEPA